MQTSPDISSFGQLPADQTFGKLLVPFLAPYLAYTALASLFPSASGQAWLQGVKLAATGLALATFWKQYRFDWFRAREFWVACVAAPVATLFWVGPACVWHTWGGAPLTTPGHDSPACFALHVVNSVLLVAVFEELLLRVYVMEWAFQAATNRQGHRFFPALAEALDEKPAARNGLPLNWVSVSFATVLFTAGHSLSEYPSAVLYFAFTTWLYRRTRSLWVCILVHAWANLLIALLVRSYGLRFLW